MSDNIVYSQIKEKAENAEPIGGTLKFKVDEIVVFIDGSGDANSISTDDKDADCAEIQIHMDAVAKVLSYNMVFEDYEEWKEV